MLAAALAATVPGAALFLERDRVRRSSLLLLGLDLPEKLPGSFRRIFHFFTSFLALRFAVVLRARFYHKDLFDEIDPQTDKSQGLVKGLY